MNEPYEKNKTNKEETMEETRKEETVEKTLLGLRQDWLKKKERAKNC